MVNGQWSVIIDQFSFCASTLLIGH